MGIRSNLRRRCPGVQHVIGIIPLWTFGPTDCGCRLSSFASTNLKKVISHSIDSIGSQFHFVSFRVRWYRSTVGGMSVGCYSSRAVPCHGRTRHFVAQITQWGDRMQVPQYCKVRHVLLARAHNEMSIPFLLFSFLRKSVIFDFVWPLTETYPVDQSGVERGENETQPPTVATKMQPSTGRSS